MLVKNLMNLGAVNIDVNDTLFEAINKMNELNIGRLMVMQKCKLVGIVSDRDLRRAAPSNATALEIHEMKYLLTKVKIKEIMTPNPIAVKQYDTVAHAAKIMYENKISGLPVVDHTNRVIGVLSRSDILRSIFHPEDQQELSCHPISVLRYAKP
jgi:acetoin utilization protein AcuB